MKHDKDDSIPALLLPGKEIIWREEAEALGLTVEAKRLPSRDQEKQSS